MARDENDLVVFEAQSMKLSEKISMLILILKACIILQKLSFYQKLFLCSSKSSRKVRTKSTLSHSVQEIRKHESHPRIFSVLGHSSTPSPHIIL
jgi:hypothetical protein